MPAVYVGQPGARITVRGGRLRAALGDQVLLDIPLAEVEQLGVLGRGVQVSTAALVALATRGVDVAFLSRGGRYFGKLSGAPNGASHLRLAQARWATDPTLALAMARWVVGAKLAGQSLLLARLGLDRAVGLVEHRRADLTVAAALEQVRGLEGAAAAAYFGALRRLFPAELGFAGRAHHPPPDPVNAALSFGYTLVLNEVVGGIHVVGLDPYVGFLHLQEPGRPSFGLDAEEELRPVVDELVLRLFRGGELRPSDFDRRPEGIRLHPEARKRFLLAYEGQMAGRLSHPLAHGQVTLRRAIELQVRLLGRVMLGEADALEPLALAELWGAEPT